MKLIVDDDDYVLYYDTVLKLSFGVDSVDATTTSCCQWLDICNCA